MGSAMGVVQMGAMMTGDNKDSEQKDSRRRNSLAFFVSQFASSEGDNYDALLEAVKKEKFAKTGGKPPAHRPSSECTTH